MTDTSSETAIEVGDLGRVAGRLRRALRNKLGSDPFLPESHAEIMRLLYLRPGLKVQEVAAALSLAPNTVSTLVQQLSRSGRIVRRADPEDGRAVRLHLSTETRRRIARRRDERRAVIEQAARTMSKKDRAVIEAAMPVLLRFAERLEDSR